MAGQAGGYPRTKVIASVSIFGVVYTVLRLIPTVPMIGLAGATFSLSDLVAPIYGVVLGPLVGGFSVILGTFLAIAFGKPVTFMFLDFLPATVNAVTVGLLMKRKRIPVALLFAALLAAYLLNPLSLVLVKLPLAGSSISIPFNWMHFAALIVLLSPLGFKAASWVRTPKSIHLAKGLAVFALIGTMAQHAAGSLLFEVVLGQYLRVIPASAYPGIWTAIFLLYPVERSILVLLAVAVGTPVVRSLKASKLIYVEG